MLTCSMCGSDLIRKHRQKYCSTRCQMAFQYNEYILDWKSGTKNGGRGIITRNISKHLKRYLMEKFGEKCSKCKWNKRHPIKGHIPLEVDHIDGNSENNREVNLRLLCPNCHSLTSNFKNLNKGRGRKWRMEKYIKNSTTGI